MLFFQLLQLLYSKTSPKIRISGPFLAVVVACP